MYAAYGIYPAGNILKLCKMTCIYIYIYKGKVFPLQGRCGPEGG